MFISCVICGDLFTGLEAHESVYLTPCGHLFHHHCILAWFERSKTCPQCRQKVTDKKILRVFFNLANAGDNDNDPGILKHRIDSLEYQAKMKDKEIKILTAERDKSIGQNGGLRREIKDALQKALSCEQAVHSLKSEIAVLRKCCKEYSMSVEENEELKRKVEALKHVQMVINGTDDEAEVALENADSYPELSRCVLFFKRRIKKLESEHRLAQTAEMSKKKKINMLECYLTQARQDIQELKQENEKLKTIASTYTGESSLHETKTKKKHTIGDNENHFLFKTGESYHEEEKKKKKKYVLDILDGEEEEPTRQVVNKPNPLHAVKTITFLKSANQTHQFRHNFRIPAKSLKTTSNEVGDDNFHPQKYKLTGVMKKPKKKLSPSATSALKNISKISDARPSNRRIDSFMETVNLVTP